MRDPIHILITFCFLTLIFFVIDLLFNKKHRANIFRKGYLLDVGYWFFTPLVTHSVTRLAVILAVVPLGLLLGLTVAALKNYHGFGPVSRQPFALQAFEIYLMGDFISYWSHRLFHGKTLWGFHAVHHGSEELDWLSSVRLHPINEALTRVMETIPLVLFGFNPLVVASFAPIMTLYAIFIHADLDWYYGPFRYLIASPAFHRWHHSKEPDAIDKNFAGLFAFWDVIFGTFYLPIDRPPCNFGIKEPIPENLVSHLVHPFVKK